MVVVVVVRGNGAILVEESVKERLQLFQRGDAVSEEARKASWWRGMGSFGFNLREVRREREKTDKNQLNLSYA